MTMYHLYHSRPFVRTYTHTFTNSSSKHGFLDIKDSDYLPLCLPGPMDQMHVSRKKKRCPRTLARAATVEIILAWSHTLLERRSSQEPWVIVLEPRVSKKYRPGLRTCNARDSCNVRTHLCVHGLFDIRPPHACAHTYIANIIKRRRIQLGSPPKISFWMERL